MSERTAVGLVYAGIFVAGLPVCFGLHALGASDQLLICVFLLIAGIAAWALSTVTVHYADARRKQHD